MRRERLALATIALLVAAAASHAASIPISNASFEDPAQTTMGTFASLTPPGGSIHDPGGITGPDTDFGVGWPTGFFDYANGAEDGIQCGVVFLDLPPDTGLAGLRHALAATLAPNTRYTFEVYVGDPTDYSDELLGGFPGYRVELLAGANLVLADDDTASHTGGSLAGQLVYDRDTSVATQVFGRDATLTVTEATGDLAAFAAIDFEDGFVNAAGIVLTLRPPGTTGNFILLLFGASLSLHQPLPVASFQSNSSSVYLASVAVIEQGESGASFTVPEPFTGATSKAFAALDALALVRRRALS
jgi:hypothetical protein